MDPSAWLARIGFTATPRADLATLVALHRAHVGRVPFENIDVQLGRRVALDAEAAYEKIVRRGRGGWCYELNGLFAWGLGELGFEVARRAAGVNRNRHGDSVLGDHLCLEVTVGGVPYLADVGFGGSMVEPLPLRAVTRFDDPWQVELSQVAGGFWRYTERTRADDAFGFDFACVPADEALLARHSHAQQSDPESSFVKNLVVQRREGERHHSLRGRVLDGRVLASADELVGALREVFALDVPEVAGLWPRICARHDEVFSKSTKS